MATTDGQTSTNVAPAGLDLSREEVHQGTIDLFNEVIIGSPYDAARFAERLRGLLDQQRVSLNQTAPDFINDYEQIIQKTSYCGLPFFSDAKVIDIFSKNLLGIVRAGFDIYEEIRLFLSRHYSFDERNELRVRLIEAMEFSEERFGGNVAIAVGERTRPGTLGAWLAYRNSILGQVLDTNIVAETSFIAQDKALNALPDDEKEIFTKVLGLYRWLHQSSLWQEGFEDRYVFKDETGLKVLRDGALVDVVDMVAIEPDQPATAAEKIPPNLAPLQPLANKTAGNKGMPVIRQETKIPGQFDPIVKENINEFMPAQPSQPMINNSQFIHNSPQVLKAARPALIFNLDDEKEADNHREKAGEPQVLEHVIRQYVAEIIKEKNLVFKDEVNQRRFVQLMVSRLKDVRGLLEIAEALRKPTEAGGLGMPEEKADQVQEIMESAKQEFEARKKTGELKAALPEPLPPPPAPVKIEPPKPTYDAEAARAWRDQMLRNIQTQGQPITVNTNVAPKQQIAIPRPQLSDVKAPPKVVGPLEELRSLTLVDFRRLGSTSVAALQKIRNKIDLLGETSIGRKLEAVRAWKSSAVYQHYLRLGRESIEQGKPVSEIVSSHSALGEPGLTEDEFSSIADFNARLRF